MEQELKPGQAKIQEPTVTNTTTNSSHSPLLKPMQQLQRYGQEKRDYNGLKMRCLTHEYKIPCEATMAINQTEKLVQKGFFVIDWHGSNSWKYPQGELVYTVYGKEYPHIEKRPFNDNYARTELPTPFNISLRLVEKLWEKMYCLSREPQP